MPRERSDVTGYREFEYPRYLAVVVWLTRHVPVVTATSLNKLMSYVDYLHGKSEAVSLTGTAYRRVQHGPVPAAYGDLQQRMELEGVIDVQEAQYKNGRTGLEIRPGAKADTVDLTFSPRELKILEAVAATFKTLTPSQIRERSHAETARRESQIWSVLTYDLRDCWHFGLDRPGRYPLPVSADLLADGAAERRDAGAAERRDAGAASDRSPRASCRPHTVL